MLTSDFDKQSALGKFWAETFSFKSIAYDQAISFCSDTCTPASRRATIVYRVHVKAWRFTAARLAYTFAVPIAHRAQVGWIDPCCIGCTSCGVDCVAGRSDHRLHSRLLAFGTHSPAPSTKTHAAPLEKNV